MSPFCGHSHLLNEINCFGVLGRGKSWTGYQRITRAFPGKWKNRLETFPIGMSGNRLALTLANELRRRGGGLGAAALCGGGGQGDALLLEV